MINEKRDIRFNDHFVFVRIPCGYGSSHPKNDAHMHARSYDVAFCNYPHVNMHAAVGVSSIDRVTVIMTAVLSSRLPKPSVGLVRHGPN